MYNGGAVSWTVEFDVYNYIYSTSFLVDIDTLSYFNLHSFFIPVPYHAYQLLSCMFLNSNVLDYTMGHSRVTLKPTFMQYPAIHTNYSF